MKPEYLPFADDIGVEGSKLLGHFGIVRGLAVRVWVSGKGNGFISE
jgi:hypothetical protein